MSVVNGHLHQVGSLAAKWNFRFEADMLVPLAAASATFGRASSTALFEVAADAGIPDVVFVDMDRDALAVRRGADALLDAVAIRVVRQMAEFAALGAQSTSAAEISVHVGVSERHLRRTVLPRLAAGGHAELAAGDRWSPTYQYRSPVRHLVTVEAKLRDWRSGVAQAGRHVAVADESWLVIDAGATDVAVAHQRWFAFYGVGLATLDRMGVVRRLLEPLLGRTRVEARAVLAERAAALHLSGAVSGPVAPVFGRQLWATAADPRRPDAAGCCHQ